MTVEAVNRSRRGPDRHHVLSQGPGVPSQPGQTRGFRAIVIVRQLVIELWSAAHSGAARRDALEGRQQSAWCVGRNGAMFLDHLRRADRQSVTLE